MRKSNNLAIIPFRHENLWGRKYEHLPVNSCEFSFWVRVLTVHNVHGLKSLMFTGTGKITVGLLYMLH